VICHQSFPFVVKRVYLNCLFEVYVNKVIDLDNDKSFTENLIGSEISEIISREVIPVLSMKTIY